MTSLIKTKAEIRGFWAQFPKTAELFGMIMTRWRASTARRPVYKGFWAAYPYRDWCNVTGLPDRTLKRHLCSLVEHGLIEKTHGKHGGNRVLTFIRPTPLALYLSDVKAADWHRLGISTDKSVSEVLPKGILAHVSDGMEGQKNG